MTKRKLAKISSDIEETIPEDMAVNCNISKCLNQLNVIKKWKIGKVADVDIYGCDTLAEPGEDPKVKRTVKLHFQLVFLGEEVSGVGRIAAVLTDKRSDNSRSCATFTDDCWVDASQYSSSRGVSAS